MVHMTSCVTLEGLTRKDCILWLRTSSWYIFDMLPMCLCVYSWVCRLSVLPDDLESTLKQIHSNVQCVWFNVCVFYKGNFKCSKGQMEAINPTQNAYEVFWGCTAQESLRVEKIFLAQWKLLKLKLLQWSLTAMVQIAQNPNQPPSQTLNPGKYLH